MPVRTGASLAAPGCPAFPDQQRHCQQRRAGVEPRQSKRRMEQAAPQREKCKLRAGRRHERPVVRPPAFPPLQLGQGRHDDQGRRCNYHPGPAHIRLNLKKKPHARNRRYNSGKDE